MRNPGYIVETASGKGRTYHKEELVNGKIIVHLLTEDFKHTIDQDGKPVRVLVDRQKIKIIGLVD